MIEIKTPQEICLNIELELFDNEDNLIGVIDNELTMLDVLLQIKVNELEHYYIKYNDVTYPIVNGNIKGFKAYNDCGMTALMKQIMGF